MHSLRFSLPLLAALAITFTLTTRTQAQTVTTFANFNGSDGSEPIAGPLIQATDGNYYGAAYYGGGHVEGTVFQVTPSGSISAIYSFCSRDFCFDGFSPESGVILGIDGSLYGTTFYGGPHGGGSVFKVTLKGELTTLYRFCLIRSCPDGQWPNGLIQASNGEFYGTTTNLGANSGGGGTIFQISSTGRFKTLYNFCSQSQCTDGVSPGAGLIQASNGNLYGTTTAGGAYNAGTVFEITLAGQLRTLYSFCAQSNCPDGSEPVGLMQAADGSLYGATWHGGAYGYGSVFKLTTTHQLITLHSFDETDGEFPGAPIQANDGNFYGTARYGSVNNGGTIYEITSSGVFSSLYSFCSSLLNCTGQIPGALWQAPNGTIYGPAFGGNGNGWGIIFGLSNGLGPLVETMPLAAKPGAKVIILGDNLRGSTGVTFNGTAATFTLVSDNEIIATVPAGATTGTVSVTTPTGTVSTNPAFRVLK